MAVTSGSFATTSCQGRSLTFSWSQKSQSIENNTTTISWELIGSGTFDGYVKCGNFKVVVNGVTVYEKDKDYRVKVYQDTKIASGTATIKHNNDGSKSFSASAQAGIYYADVNCKGSGSWTLNTISRASQPSIITYPSTTENIGYIGTTVKIHMNSASSSFKHTVKYSFQGLTGEIAKDVVNNTTWIIPTDFIEKLPNSTIGEGTIEVITYNGGTKIGSKSVTFKTTVPTNIKPSVGTITLDPQTYDLLVQGKNNLQISVSGCSAGTGSSISSYTFSGPGINSTSTSTSATTDTISDTGTLTYRVTVTDTRGRTASKTKTIACYEWFNPWFSSFNAYRSDKKGNASDKGKYATIKCGVSYADVNKINTITIKIQVKKDGSTTWTTKPKLATSPANAYTVELDDTTSTFLVRATVTDKYGGSSTSKERTTSGEKKILNVLPDGSGVAFGKMAATANTLDTAWAIKTDKPVETMKNLTYKEYTGDDNATDWGSQGNLATMLASSISNTNIKFPNGDTDKRGFILNLTSGLVTSQLWVPNFGTTSLCYRYYGSFDKWITVLDEDNTADYVVEQGAKSVTNPACTWTYRKWNSGLIECFGSVSISNQAPTGRWWPFVYYKIDLPTFPVTFTQKPNVMVSWNDGHAAVIGNVTGTTVTTGGKVDLYRPPESATNYNNTSTFETTNISGTIVIEVRGT